jgi:hypothetical protein
MDSRLTIVCVCGRLRACQTNVLISNNLTIIVVHTTYSILLFIDFYGDMFRYL